jgi:hypothetical protein
MSINQSEMDSLIDDMKRPCCRNCATTIDALCWGVCCGIDLLAAGTNQGRHVVKILVIGSAGNRFGLLVRTWFRFRSLVNSV